MEKYASFLFLVLYIFALPLHAKVDRFEELFIWKMSEALSLDASQEADFASLLKKLNKDKAEKLAAINKITAEMAKVKTDESAQKLLSSYRKHLQDYQQINQNEIDDLAKIINPNQLAKYLSYKSVVLEKLQSRLKSLSESNLKTK